MPDKSGSRLVEELKSERAIADDSNRVNAPQSVQARVWDRTDRIRLLMWAGIAFLPPLLLRLAFHSLASRNELTVQSELPITAVRVVFVSLATWIVSGIEKRLLIDSGGAFRAPVYVNYRYKSFRNLQRQTIS
jgi:hypothetical protein